MLYICVFSMYIYVCMYVYIYIHTLDTQTYVVSLYIERLHLIMQNHHFSYPVFTRSGCLRGVCALRRCQTSASHLRMAYTMKKCDFGHGLLLGFPYIYICT